MFFSPDEKIISEESSPSFNFIWLGNPLKPEYLRSLFQFLKIAKRSNYRVNLWVDNKDNFYGTFKKVMTEMGIDDPNELDISLSGLALKNIDELKVKMFGDSADDFYKNNPGLADEFWKIVTQEMTGLANWAAASDLLRCEILRQLDNAPYNIYMDLDFALQDEIADDERIRFSTLSDINGDFCGFLSRFHQEFTYYQECCYMEISPPYGPEKIPPEINKNGKEAFIKCGNAVYYLDKSGVINALDFDEKTFKFFCDEISDVPEYLKGKPRQLFEYELEFVREGTGYNILPYEIMICDDIPEDAKNTFIISKKPGGAYFVNESGESIKLVFDNTSIEKDPLKYFKIDMHGKSKKQVTLIELESIMSLVGNDDIIMKRVDLIIGNNDLIISKPHHEISERFILLSLDRYKKLSSIVLQDQDEEKSHMQNFFSYIDLKRRFKNNFSDPGVNLTLYVTGPTAMGEVLYNWIGKNGCPPFLCTLNDNELFGVPFKMEAHGNWRKGNRTRRFSV